MRVYVDLRSLTEDLEKGYPISESLEQRHDVLDVNRPPFKDSPAGGCLPADPTYGRHVHRERAELGNPMQRASLDLSDFPRFSRADVGADV